MRILVSKLSRWGALGLVLMSLAACNSGGGGGGAGATSTPPATTGEQGRNTGDNVTRESGTGTEAAIGFSATRFPGSRPGVTAPNTTLVNAAAEQASILNGIAAAAPVTVLQMNSSNAALVAASGNYDPATLEVTTGGQSFDVANRGNRYSGAVIAGGDSLVVIQETPAASLPNGSASYSGTGDVVYVNGPTSQAFTGKMTATVRANFDSNRVSIVMTNPRGSIDGRAYQHGGSMRIDDLALSGARYQDDGRTTGRVTGFRGAANLNSGSQTVDAIGVFGGPNGEETGAVARIDDGNNGTAIIRLTADR